MLIEAVAKAAFVAK